MFRNREAGEFGYGYDIPADYQLTNVKFEVKNLGSIIGSSKKSYHWSFDVRVPGAKDDLQNWSLISVTLTDSCLSHKKTLVVNCKKVLDKEKL